MDFRNTKHQVARGSRADAEDHARLYLFKKVSFLGLTYQIKLLTYFAAKSDRKLEIRVPSACTFSKSLTRYIREHKKHIETKKV